jgi:chemotaxis protein MotB
VKHLEAVVIVRKKKAGHGRHHGGAWKVAYADFVTAMMALFIVLWLMNSTPKIKESVAGYFKDPTGATKQTGATMGGQGEALAKNSDSLAKLKEGIEEALRKMPEFHDRLGKQVELTLTKEGLRIELVENAGGLLFESANATPTASGVRLLGILAEQLGKVPNPVAIEGHTDAVPYGGDGRYSNWELSADRANSARRLMATAGLWNGQVTQVRGYAAGSLRRPELPNDPSNRRISLVVGFVAASANVKTAGT